MTTSDGIKHGLTGYVQGKCRCDICKAAKKASNDRSRQRDPARFRAVQTAYRNANRDRINELKRLARLRNVDHEREMQMARYYRNHAHVLELRRKWHAANPERIVAWNKARYAKNRDVLLAKNREWRKANREKDRISKAIYQRTHRDLFRASVAAWHKRNPGAAAQFKRARRARKRTNGIFVVTAKDWRRLCERYRNRCAYCGVEASLTEDHVIPLVRGGRHSIGNLLPACISCNCSKRSSFLIEWSGRPT